MSDPHPSPEVSADGSVVEDETLSAPALPTEEDTSPSTTPGTPTPADPPPADPPPAGASPASERVFAGANGLLGWLSRPRVRLMLVGALLVAAGGLIVTGSAWTAPLIIAGVAMMVIASCGSRLDGRLVLEWGSSGAKLEFRAGIVSPHRRPGESAPTSAAQDVTTVGPEPEPLRAGDLKVEIDVAELERLIGVAEAARYQDPKGIANNGSARPNSISE